MFKYAILASIVTIILVALLRKRCRHIWKGEGQNEISLSSTDSYGQVYNKRTQVVELYTCQNCGKIIQVNHTTGDRKDVCAGGTPIDMKGIMK